MGFIDCIKPSRPPLNEFFFWASDTGRSCPNRAPSGSARPNRSSFLLVATCIAALIHSVHADSSHFLGSQPVSLWVSFTGHESTMCSHVGRLLAVLTIYLFGQIRRLRGGSELWTTKPSVVTWFRCFDPPKQSLFIIPVVWSL